MDHRPHCPIGSGTIVRYDVKSQQMLHLYRVCWGIVYRYGRQKTYSRRIHCIRSEIGLLLVSYLYSWCRFLGDDEHTLLLSKY